MHESAPELEVYKRKLKIKNLNKLGKPLVDLYEIDSKLGEKYCIYVFLAEDISKRNPIGSMQDADRRSEAMRILFGKENYKFSDTVQRAIDAASEYYRERVNDQFEREMHTYDTKLDELGTLLDGIAPVITKNTSEKTSDVTFTSNIDLLNKVLKDIIDIIQTKTTLEAMYAAGELNEGLHIHTHYTPADSGKITLKNDKN